MRRVAKVFVRTLNCRFFFACSKRFSTSSLPMLIAAQRFFYSGIFGIQRLSSAARERIRRGLSIHQGARPNDRGETVGATRQHHRRRNATANDRCQLLLRPRRTPRSILGFEPSTMASVTLRRGASQPSSHPPCQTRGHHHAGDQQKHSRVGNVTAPDLHRRCGFCRVRRWRRV